MDIDGKHEVLNTDQYSGYWPYYWPDFSASVGGLDIH